VSPFQAAYWYFSVVFTIAFLLKPIEYLWLAPELGKRAGNWSGIFLLLVGTILTARWVVSKLEQPATPKRRLAVGLIAFGLVAASELVIAFWIRHLSLQEYLTEGDPATTAAYWSGLLTFAIMPLVTGRQ
jgi:hypothetical protein